MCVFVLCASVLVCYYLLLVSGEARSIALVLGHKTRSLQGEMLGSRGGSSGGRWRRGGAFEGAEAGSLTGLHPVEAQTRTGIPNRGAISADRVAIGPETEA